MRLSIRPAGPTHRDFFDKVGGIDPRQPTARKTAVQAHRWPRHDLATSDKSVVTHHARRCDAHAVRDLHRTIVADIAPTQEQAA